MKALLAFLLLPLALSAVEVRFAWRANTEPDLAGYRLYHGPAPGFYTNAVNLGQVTACMLDVEPGLHYFALTAFDTEEFESDFTAPMAWQSMAVISERSVDGVFWNPSTTNHIANAYPMEFWRLRIERP